MLTEVESLRLQLAAAQLQNDALVKAIGDVTSLVPRAVYVQFTPKRDAVRDTPKCDGNYSDWMLLYVDDDMVPTCIGRFSAKLNEWYSQRDIFVGGVRHYRELPRDEMPFIAQRAELSDAEIDAVWRTTIGGNAFGFISKAHVVEFSRALIKVSHGG